MYSIEIKVSDNKVNTSKFDLNKLNEFICKGQVIFIGNYCGVELNMLIRDGVIDNIIEKENTYRVSLLVKFESEEIDLKIVLSMIRWYVEDNLYKVVGEKYKNAFCSINKDMIRQLLYIAEYISEMYNEVLYDFNNEDNNVLCVYINDKSCIVTRFIKEIDMGELISIYKDKKYIFNINGKTFERADIYYMLHLLWIDVCGESNIEDIEYYLEPMITLIEFLSDKKNESFAEIMIYQNKK